MPTFVECLEDEAVVYIPGTTDVATTCPTLEIAIAFARAEWPACEIRLITSIDVRAIREFRLHECAHAR